MRASERAASAQDGQGRKAKGTEVEALSRKKALERKLLEPPTRQSNPLKRRSKLQKRDTFQRRLQSRDKGVCVVAVPIHRADNVYVRIGCHEKQGEPGGALPDAGA